LNALKPGDCFGDLLYFTGRSEPRTTTVAAIGQISVIEINAPALRTATDAFRRVQQGVRARAGAPLGPDEPAPDQAVAALRLLHVDLDELSLVGAALVVERDHHHTQCRVSFASAESTETVLVLVAPAR